MKYEITRYHSDLRPGVVALQRFLVSRDVELNDAYFRWKHETNPYTRVPLVYVALADGEVAGMRAFLGARWQLGADGASVFWPCACDFVVAPEHRRNKLFRRIMDFAIADLAEKRIGPLLRWSASPITCGASPRSGWQLVGTYAAWARHTARARHIRRGAERLRRLPLVWRMAEVPVSLGLKARLGECGLAPDDWTRGLQDYQPGLLAIGPRDADPVATAHLAGFDRWDLRPLYSDFY